jgi:hypothetical protein
METDGSVQMDLANPSSNSPARLYLENATEMRSSLRSQFISPLSGKRVDKMEGSFWTRMRENIGGVKTCWHRRRGMGHSPPSQVAWLEFCVFRAGG